VSTRHARVRAPHGALPLALTLSLGVRKTVSSGIEMCFSIDMRLLLSLCLAMSAASACDCIGPAVHEELDRSSIVFRGVVTNIREFPPRPDMDRARNVVTFSVSAYWKGNSGKEIILHLLAPRPDCNGADFEVKKEYVVFAESHIADDVRIENELWFGWLDLLPAGTQIFTARSLCSNTAEAVNARKTLRALGKGSKPRS
jgi:hypothetical protein